MTNNFDNEDLKKQDGENLEKDKQSANEYQSNPFLDSAKSTPDESFSQSEIDQESADKSFFESVKSGQQSEAQVSKESVNSSNGKVDNSKSLNDLDIFFERDVKKDDVFFERENKEVDKKLTEVKPQSPSGGKKSTFKRGFSFLMSALILVLTFIFGFVSAQFGGSSDKHFASWAVDLINNEAWFAKSEVTSYELIKYGVFDVLYEDPYVGVFNEDEVNQIFAQIEGSTKNIGMSVGEYEGKEGIYILALTMGSTAEVSGMIVGSRVVSVDGMDFWDKKMEELSNYILSIPDDTNITVVLAEPYVVGSTLFYDSDNPKTFIVSRTEYIERVVDYFDNTSVGLEGFLDDKTAIIQLRSFMGDTASQFDQAMATFKERGKTRLILDLRDNLGGSDINLKAVGAHLLSDGKNSNVHVMTQKYKNGSEKKMYTDDCYYDQYGFERIIVLTNENSASASEALLIAMKDYGTADLIIGATTYGKGTGLITHFMPGYRYAIRFTDSYFYSPFGNTNEKVGISPTAGYGMEQNYSKNFPYSMRKDNIIERAVNSLK